MLHDNPLVNKLAQAMLDSRCMRGDGMGVEIEEGTDLTLEDFLKRAGIGWPWTVEWAHVESILDSQDESPAHALTRFLTWTKSSSVGLGDLLIDFSTASARIRWDEEIASGDAAIDEEF